MRLLVDAGVGRAADSWLKGTAHDVACVRDVDPRMPDQDIPDWAVREDRVLVTMDLDFGEMIHAARLAHRGVLLLRLDDDSAAGKIAALDAIRAQHADKLPLHFCVYKAGRLRVR